MAVQGSARLLFPRQSLHLNGCFWLLVSLSPSIISVPMHLAMLPRRTFPRSCRGAFTTEEPDVTVEFRANLHDSGVAGSLPKADHVDCRCDDNLSISRTLWGSTRAAG